MRDAATRPGERRKRTGRATPATSPSFLGIVGATTSGKTALALAVARRLDGEIVSMDSRQVYRGMDVGTDKASLVDRARVPHHGLDLMDPDARYSAGQFARDARGWVRDIRSRGRVPVLAGGTGFFLRALLDPIFEEPPLEEARLLRLRAWLSSRPRETLAAWIRRLDPARAEVAIQGGPQRMTRTLEVALLTGRSLSWWHLNAEPEAPGLPGMVVVLSVPREELDRRIDARVGRMVERGLVDEVRTLLAAGFGPGDPGMTGTGYREISDVLAGSSGTDDALDAMRLQTRQYARRQLTWLRRQLPDDAHVVNGLLPLERQVEAVARAWREAKGDDGP